MSRGGLMINRLVGIACEAMGAQAFVELTLRCYLSEQGHAPTHLTELIPKYLQRVPLDPFSNSSLVYRSQGTNWLLYSLGPDGVDDGGKPIDRTISSAYLIGFGNSGSASRERKKGDLFYDSPW
jgi:hypothetical protein